MNDLKKTKGHCSCGYNNFKSMNYRAYSDHLRKLIEAKTKDGGDGDDDDASKSAAAAAATENGGLQNSADAASAASSEVVKHPFFPIPLPKSEIKRIFGYCRPFLSYRPRSAKASAMQQIAATEAGDDSDDGAVANSVRKKQRTSDSGGSSSAAPRHKWIPDDPSTWNWKEKKGKGRCACGCVVGQSWHTFNRKTKG